MKKLFYSIIFLIISIIQVIAQSSYHFTQYKTSDGLFQKTITNILQDKKGFMWFATWDGIYKFDGYRFENYKNNNENRKGFNNNRIDTLIEGPGNYLWMISYNRQVYCFDMENNTFLSIPFYDYQARNIYASHHEYTWIITTDKRLIELRPKKNRESIQTYDFFKKNHIQSQQVNHIYEDYNHNLWILTQTGVYKLEFNQSNHYVIRHYLPQAILHDVTENSQYIFFTTNKGHLWIYNKQKHNFTQRTIGVNSDLLVIRKMSQDLLIIGTKSDGILIYHSHKGIIAQFTKNNTPILTNDQIKEIYIDSKSNAWIRIANTLGVFHIRLTPKPQLEHFTLKDSSGEKIVNSRPEMYVCEDIHQNIWIHPSGGGLGYYDPKTNSLNPFFNPNNQSGWNSENKVTSIFSDRQGNLWIGSYNNGLEKVTFNTYKFHLIQNKSNDNESLENYIRASFQDNKGNLWTGFKDKTIRIYNNQLQFIGYLTRQGTLSKTQKDFIGMAYCFTEDHKGRIWIGTKGNGIFIATPLSKNHFKLEQYIHNNQPYSINHNDIYSICEDQQHRMWIATFGGGINCVDLNHNSQIRFIHSGNLLKKYPNHLCNRVRHVTIDSKGNIWIGTTNGLIYAPHPTTKIENINFYHYTYQGLGNKSISNNNIYQIFVSRTSPIIYLATFGGGLNKLTYKNDNTFLFQSYTTSNRLPANVILSLEEDKHGNLWIATEEELCKFNPLKNEVITYTSKDFPTSFKFNEGTALCLQNEYLLFNTLKGILYFHPDSIEPSHYIPPIVFTRLQIGEHTIIPSDSSIIQKNIDETQHITLTHKHNGYNIQFAALDMKDHENLFYAYKLEGFDKKWNYIGQERSANYTNLPQGNYTLKVRSTNSDGIWVNNTRSLNITVLPSFWQTPWAYICYTLTIVLIIFITSYILFIFYRLKHKISIEQEITDIKLRFFTNISHELRTPLTLIYGPLDLLQKRNDIPLEAQKQLETITRNTKRMLRLINQILDFRKIENKKMKLQIQQIQILPFIQQIGKSFQQLASDQQINLQIKASSPSIIVWADSDKLEKIIFNLLSNAFKYTHKGKRILLTITEQENTISISIADQGIGMTKAQLKRLFIRFESFQQSPNSLQGSTGIGLSLTKELVEMHHGKILVESQLGVGSRFIVMLKKGKEHFGKDVEYIISDNLNNFLSVNTTSPQETINLNQLHSEHQSNTLLLVEDNVELRNFMKQIFSENYFILEASNGMEGEKLATEYIPDIIISDIMMPEKDGICLLSDLKNEESTRHIPIILLSAKSAIENKLEGLNCGADDYITKPFSVDYLKVRVQNLIAQRRLLQQIYCKTLLPSTQEKKEMTKTSHLTQHEEIFMNKLMEIITQNMDNSDFSIEDIANSLGMSRSVFFRKLKSITGLSPIEFLKQMRMKRAVQLLESGDYIVSEIAYLVGFNDAHYFSKCFKQTFHISPTEYKDKINKLSQKT